jgi:hypothetical protein
MDIRDFVYDIRRRRTTKYLASERDSVGRVRLVPFIYRTAHADAEAEGRD